MLHKRQGRKAKEGRRERAYLRVMLVVLARQLAERAVLVPQVVRVVVLPLHGTMPNPASLRGSCEQRARERRLVSANPTRKAKTLPRGVPVRGCAARQQELIPPPSSPLRWATRVTGTQRTQPCHPAAPRGTFAGR